MTMPSAASKSESASPRPKTAGAAKSPTVTSPSSSGMIGLKKAFERLSVAHLCQIITAESIIILMLIGLTFMIRPMFDTRYILMATTPEHQVSRLTPILMPNLTSKAIKAWAASSVTEILTIGFGDFNQKLVAQKERFTSAGWSDFVQAFLNKKVGESFKQSRLVLTSVPSEDPTIIEEGPDEEHIYKWVVEVPVIMTYASNNEVTRPEKSKVTLTIVRVPPEQTSRGMAIDTWHQK